MDALPPDGVRAELDVLDKLIRKNRNQHRRTRVYRDVVRLRASFAHYVDVSDVESQISSLQARNTRDLDDIYDDALALASKAVLKASRVLSSCDATTLRLGREIKRDRFVPLYFTLLASVAVLGNAVREKRNSWASKLIDLVSSCMLSEPSPDPAQRLIATKRITLLHSLIAFDVDRSAQERERDEFGDVVNRIDRSPTLAAFAVQTKKKRPKSKKKSNKKRKRTSTEGYDSLDELFDA